MTSLLLVCTWILDVLFRCVVGVCITVDGATNEFVVTVGVVIIDRSGCDIGIVLMLVSIALVRVVLLFCVTSGISLQEGNDRRDVFMI